MIELHTKANANSYNEAAQFWDEQIHSNTSHNYLEKPAMEAELPETLQDKSVLNVGVGSGGNLETLLKLNPQAMVGIDISCELLKLAEQRHPQVTFQEMDMNNMTFARNEFDLVYSSLAFHYTNDWDKLLNGVNRVLKPGGTLLFSTHNPSYWGKHPATGKQYVNERGVALPEHTATILGSISITYYNHPNPESIREALEYADFKVESFFNPEVIDVEVGSDMLPRYESLKAKNENTSLFLVAKARKL